MSKKRFIGICIVLVLIAITGGIVIYRSSHQTFEAGSENKLSDNQVKDIIANVSRHIVLPDENPLVATVTDVETLKQSQAFYQNAHNGDILLIYATNGKAILYDPTRDVLVNVGPIIVDDKGTANTTTTKDTTSRTE